MESAWEVLEMEDDECEEFLETLPFGKKYLVAREKPVTRYQKRKAVELVTEEFLKVVKTRRAA